jgi:sigma-B regulation protein RsbU (phosphoserine phosphatase)
MFPLRLPIRWKLVLWIGLPMLIIYGGALTYAYVMLRLRGEEEVRASMNTLTARHAAHVDEMLQRIAQVARSTAAFLAVHPDVTEAELYELLETNVRHSDLIYGSCVAYEPSAMPPFAAGRPRLAPYACRRGITSSAIRRMDVVHAYDYADGTWEWFATPRNTGEALWTEPFFDEGAGDIAMCTYAAPIVRGGSFIGVATVDLPLKRLRDVIGTIDLMGGESVIVSRSGGIINHPDASRPGRLTIQELVARSGSAQAATLAREIAAGARGSTRMPEGFREEPHWIFYAPVPSARWTFVITVAEAEVMRFANRQLAFGIGVMLAGLGLITAMLLLLATRLTRPVTRLAGAVRTLGAGDLQARAPDAHRRDELGELARAFNAMVSKLQGHIAALTEATAAREAVESELRVARNIQSTLLPRTFPAFPDRTEFDLHAVIAPAKHVAGDFYDYFFAGPDSLVFVIGDVSGKGVPAAIFMAVSRTVIRNLAAREESPAAVLKAANDVLVRDSAESMFVTMFIARYDVRTGRLRYANAGHPPPLRLDSAGRVQRFGTTTGTVLGMIPEAIYTEGEARLEPGETLILYTDGLPEARSPRGEFFGDERVMAAVLAGIGEEPAALCRRISETTAVFQAGAFADDLTLLVVARRR